MPFHSFVLGMAAVVFRFIILFIYWLVKSGEEKSFFSSIMQNFWEQFILNFTVAASSDAKCHCQCHKKIWLKQNPCQRHVLNCDNQRWYSERLVWPIYAHDLFTTIAWSDAMSRLFLLWSVLQNVTDLVMRNSGWNKITSASRALLWWSEASLKQLVQPSHAWWHCDRQIIKTYRGESMLTLLLEPTHQVYSKNVVIIADKNVVTKWVTKSWMLIKMSPSKWLILQLFESCHWSKHLCTCRAMSVKLPWICSLFSLVRISWYSWHFAALTASDGHL